MAVTESFLVNTNSFNSIIEALIEYEGTPDKITDELFTSLGFDSPSDLLVIHMLKELGMVTVEGDPTELYTKLVDKNTTDEAIATGIITAYTDLFEDNTEFHKLQKEDIHQALDAYFEGRKTDLIIKYMTNTFHKLVTYAGLNNVQKAVDRYFKSTGETVQTPPAEIEEAAEDISVEEPTGETTDIEETEDTVEDDIEMETEEESFESDSEFDDIFFGDDEEEELEDEPEETVSEVDQPEDRKKDSINFDELPKVQHEEKGSKNIDELLDEEEPEEFIEEESAEVESEDLEEDSHTENEQEQTEEYETEEISLETKEQSISAEEQESLEKELMEINLTSTNGFHKNGAENEEKPMANFANIPTNEKIEKAIIKKAELLYKLDRFEDVLPAYSDVISHFDDSEKDHLKKAVAHAVINRVSVLNKLDREDELLPAIDEVINRFKDSSTTEYYEHASMAMLQKSQLLEDESPEVLLPLFEAIIARLRNASSPKIKTQVDDVFVNRVDILTETGPEHELLDAVDDLIDRFEGSQLHTGQLEQAMYKKAEVLEDLNRDEEALEAYSEFLEKFGKTTEMA